MLLARYRTYTLEPGNPVKIRKGWKWILPFWLLRLLGWKDINNMPPDIEGIFKVTRKDDDN